MSQPQIPQPGGQESATWLISLVMQLVAIPSRLEALASAVTQLTATAERQMQQTEQLQKKLEPVALISGLRQQLTTLTESVNAGQLAVQDLYRREECLEHASRQQATLSERFYEETIIDPLARTLFAVMDLIEEGLKSQNSAAVSTDGSASSWLQGLQLQVAEVLEIYRIEPLFSQPGAQFKPRCMQPLEFIATADPALDKTVARSLRYGFQRGERILRPEMVVLYRFEGNQIRQISGEKGITL